MYSRIPALYAIVVSLGFGSVAGAQTTVFAKPQARIVQSIDESATVTLDGNVHPLAAVTSASKAADLGTPMEHMVLHLKGDANQEAQLDQLIGQQNDPKSALYHQYLSPATFGEQFGVAQADINKVTNWLESQGFTVEQVPAGNRTIIFSGTAAQVANAFKTEIRQYTVKGASHFANASDPQIPAALAATVGGIVKLHDFRHTTNLKYSGTAIGQVGKSQFAASSGNYLAPADYATIYDINPLYSAGVNGTGETIAILARSDIYMSDVQSFRSTFGLKANNPQFIVTNSDPGVLDGDSVETTLDTEWSGAVAPNAAVKVIISSSTNSADGIDLSAIYAVNNNVAPIVSLSYGQCEAWMGTTEMAFYNSLWKQAASQGQSVMVSAGDSGAAGCDSGSESSAAYGKAVNGLCSSPYSTCVGGTEFAEGNNSGQYWQSGNSSVYGSAISYIPETVWNESGTNGGSGLWSGGGGASIAYPKPSWQTGPGVPADGMRDVPDVSLTASMHDGYVIALEGGLYPVGGTSAAAPSFAGLMALVDQKTGARQGLINSTLYPLATAQAAGGAKVFHDTITGNNTVPGVTGFSATSGYDRASGLGSVDANVLVNSWGGSTTAAASLSLTASASSVTVLTGQTGQVTITSTANSVLKAAVALTVIGAPSGLTATLSSATIASPGSGSATLKVSAAANATPGTYSLLVSGTGGGKTATATISVVIPTPTYTFAASATSVTLAAGATGQVAVSTAPQNGFSSTITLSVAGLPTGVTAAFSPATLAGATAASSTLKFTATTAVTAGTYQLTVAGISGSQNQHATVSLIISKPTFTLAASTTSVSLSAASLGQFSVKMTPQSGFSSTVTLAVSGLPTKVTAAFSATTIAGATGGSSTITLTAATGAAAGTYPVTITATGGGVTQTAAVTLTIPSAVKGPSFSFAVNVSAVTIAQGASGSMTTSTGNYAGGFNGQLSILFSGLVPGMNYGFTSANTNNNMVNITYAFSVAKTTVAGTYPITITATGQGVTHSQVVMVTVTSATSQTKN